MSLLGISFSSTFDYFLTKATTSTISGSAAEKAASINNPCSLRRDAKQFL